MQLNIIDEQGHTIHTINTELRNGQAGVAISLLLLLYAIPEEQRDTFIAYFLDASVDDPSVIAEAIGIQPATVKERFARARRAFRRLIKSTKGRILKRRDLAVRDDTSKPDDSVEAVVFSQQGVSTWGIAESSARNLVENVTSR